MAKLEIHLTEESPIGLGEEVWLHILSFLEPDELCQAALISRAFRRLANDWTLWRLHNLREAFEDEETCAGGPRDYRRTFVNQTILLRNWSKFNCSSTILPIPDPKWCLVPNANRRAATGLAACADMVVCGTTEGCVHVLFTRTGKFQELAPPRTLFDEVSCVAVNEDVVAAGYTKGRVVVWPRNALDQRGVAVINNDINDTARVHRYKVSAIALCKTDSYSYVITASRDHGVALIVLDDMPFVMFKVQMGNMVSAIDVIHNSVFVAHGDVISVLSVPTLATVETLRMREHFATPDGDIEAISVSGKGLAVAIRSEVFLFNLHDFSPIIWLHKPELGGVCALDAAGSRLLISYCSEHQLASRLLFVDMHDNAPKVVNLRQVGDFVNAVCLNSEGGTFLSLFSLDRVGYLKLADFSAAHKSTVDTWRPQTSVGSLMDTLMMGARDPEDRRDTLLLYMGMGLLTVVLLRSWMRPHSQAPFGGVASWFNFPSDMLG